MPYYQRVQERRQEEEKAGIGEWIPLAAEVAGFFGGPEVVALAAGASFLYSTFKHNEKQRSPVYQKHSYRYEKFQKHHF